MFIVSTAHHHWFTRCSDDKIQIHDNLPQKKWEASTGEFSLPAVLDWRDQEQKKEFTVRKKKTQLPALHTSPFRSNRTQTLKTIQMLSHKAIWRHLKTTYLKPVVKQCQHLSCNTEWQNYQWLFYFAESQKQANTNWKPSDKNPFKQRSFQKLATE